MAENLLEVNNLKTYFFTRSGVVKAVDDVSFTIKPSETLGVVGESGCGKSVTALSVMRLIASPPGKIVGGEINFNGEDVLEKNHEELTELRGSKISFDLSGSNDLAQPGVYRWFSNCRDGQATSQRSQQ